LVPNRLATETKQYCIGPAHITYIKRDGLVAIAVATLLKLLAGQQLSKDSLVVLTLSEKFFVREVYKRSDILNELRYPFRWEALHLSTNL